MMGCFIGFLGLRKRSQRGLKATNDPNHRERSYAENVVGHRRAKALERRGGGAKTSEAAVLGFVLEDLLSASAEFLGKGAFSSTYRADLELLGKCMVVKRLRDFYTPQDFQWMVDAIDGMNHENLLPLTAYHNSKEEKLLVYEFLPTGSLYALLHAKGSGGYKSLLSWDKRINIALGVARAIAHTHSQSPSTFHGNIKSSEIILTSTLEPRVSDYGLAQYGPVHLTEFAPPSDRVDGYWAPELTSTKKMSQKADVYSFGVVFMELLTGKDPNESYLKDEGMDLPMWILSALNSEWTSEVFDVELLSELNAEMLMQYLELAFLWTARDPAVRPSMARVVTQLENLSCSSSSGNKKVTDIEDWELLYLEYLTDSCALPYSFYSW